MYKWGLKIHLVSCELLFKKILIFFFPWMETAHQTPGRSRFSYPFYRWLSLVLKVFLIHHATLCVLVVGQYQDPWQYVDDIWLMFNNAWLYNRKTSRVYKYCSKLAEVFEQEIDPVMQSLGYCCGRKVSQSAAELAKWVEVGNECCYGLILWLRLWSVVCCLHVPYVRYWRPSCWFIYCIAINTSRIMS